MAVARAVTKKASIASLESLRVDPLIELELQIPFDLFVPRAGTPVETRDRLGVSDLVERAIAKPLMILGPPGAGKTTLLVQLADSTRRQRGLTPIFLSLARYNPEQNLGSTVTSMGRSLANCFTKLRSQKILLLLDGVNEAPLSDLDPLIEQITAFAKNQPNIHATICTCRTIDFPRWARESFGEVRLQPPTFDQVCAYLRSGLISQFNETKVDAFLSDRRVRAILRICNTPLLLVMLYQSSKQSELRDFSFLASRAALYERFSSNLLARDLAKRRPTKFERQMLRGLHDVLLSWVGWQMQTRDLVYAREGAIEGWVAAWLQANDVSTWVEDSTTISASSLTRYLLGRPPFRVVDDLIDQDKLVAFLHPSFGEFFAGKYHHSQIAERGTSPVIDTLVHDKTRKNWETIRFLSGLSAVGTIAEVLLSLAATKRDQELMAIAALVSIDRVNATVTDIEDVVLRVLDAFKNWGNAFQYDIIRVMQTLPSQILSVSESRLFEDIRYFLDKYAHTEAIDLRQTSIVQLGRLLESDSEEAQVHAAYTLSRRAALRHITNVEVSTLVRKYFRAVCSSAQEHLMVCLKEAPSTNAFNLLVEVVQDVDSPPKVRGYALNALGTSRDERAVEVIVSYLGNHNNPYRDSASWSLQVLARALFKDRPDRLREIQDTFFDLLIHEVSDQTGRYSKGNLVYSIGALQAVHLGQHVVNWLPTERDPYVIEDALFCLGLLGIPRDELAAAVRPFLEDRDPGVRLKAVESIGLLSPSWASTALAKLGNEEFAYIKWATRAAIEKIGLP